jgi:hypothetical protein
MQSSFHKMPLLEAYLEAHGCIDEEASAEDDVKGYWKILQECSRLKMLKYYDSFLLYRILYDSFLLCRFHFLLDSFLQ